MTQDQISIGWWQHFGACCSPCYVRKGGSSGKRSIVRYGPERKIVLVGANKTGKSRILSVVSSSASTDPVKEYAPTSGTRSTIIKRNDVAVTLVEISGALSTFWPRMIDARVDGIWYLISKSEFELGDYHTLVRFLKDVRDTVHTNGISVLVSFVGIDQASGKCGSSLDAALASIDTKVQVSTVKELTALDVNSSMDLWISQMRK